MPETYAQRVGLNRPAPKRAKVPPWVLAQYSDLIESWNRPPSMTFDLARLSMPKHVHTWCRNRRRLMAYRREGMPGRYPRCETCGEYGRRFAG